GYPSVVPASNLKCSICLDLFSDPRVLPVLHIYCLKCLQGLVSKEKSYLSCPQCRAKHEIPKGDVANYLCDLSILPELEAAKATSRKEEARCVVYVPLLRNLEQRVCSQRDKLEAEIIATYDEYITKIQAMKEELLKQVESKRRETSLEETAEERRKKRENEVKEKEVKTKGQETPEQLETSDVMDQEEEKPAWKKRIDERRYCQDCGEYLCSYCQDMHNK
ncbi:E3 ubiquitin-protein ligase TRIM13-like, partial [Gigantopelta aegis]|uniref:E3 ubiquitin-protein ligase TRIM13-like n=1 Tax=Gigantopelta aegis TaxID=1735272 RepID=UPI001B88D171